MAAHDKEPLSTIYHFDIDPRLKNKTYCVSSVWQLTKLIVKQRIKTC